MSTRKASSFPVIERHLLSINQQGVWFDLQTLPTSHQHAYHLALDYTYTSTSTSLDMHALKNATYHLQQCHPMLRTTFTDDSDEMETNVDPNITSIIDSLDGQPYYRVHEIDECITFYQHDMPQDKDDLIHTSFDLRHQFPIRVHVYPTSTSTSSTYIILILIHHLVADGFSLKLIHHQFWDAYQHYTSQSHDVASPSHDIPLPIPPSITYTHHVDDESTAMITESSHRKTSSSTWWSQAEQYWMNVAPTRAPYHRIPMERDVKTTTTTITPSTTSTWKDSHTPCINAHHDIHIPIEMYQHLLSYAQQHNITLFTLLSSIIYIWLYRYHGHIDVDEEVHIPIGIALNGRPRHPSHGNVIGFYSNPMPITCSLMRQHTLKDVINSVKSHLSLAKQHERYPSTQLSRRMRSSHVTNMYHVAMTSISVFQQPYQHVTCNHHLYTQQPMLIDLYGINRAHDSIRIMYNPTLFTHSTIQRMMSNLMILMQHICNDDVMSISNIPMIHHEEQNLILHTFNAHKNSAYLGQTLHGRFEKQAYETPHAMACIDPHTSITYQQLDRAATKLAMYLRERMIKRGDTTTISIPSPSPSSAHPATPIICIVVDPVISTLIGFIGIHKAGYAYVVIDSTWPSERISFVATNSHAVDIVYATTRVYDLTHTYLESVITTTPIVIDSDNYQQHVAHIDISTYVGVYDTHNLAYMLYTSGTTGVPKGVEIEHISICNTISCIQEYMCISPHDRFLQMVSMAFDPCQMEIYITLWHGASLILPDRDMMGTITKHHVTILNMVPSLLATIDPADVPSVRLVQIGGEPLPLALAHAWARRGQAINAYGPTECAVETHRQILSASQDKITIGSAITNTTTYVLDAVTHQPVPIGVVGVIFVGGPQLARGYHARDDLNTRAFIRNPWSDDSPYSHRLYNTGDMGMWHADGTISCLARVDSQIKWHGYRIELHEIESCIMTHQHVTSCCVVLHRFHTSEDVDADSCLVAYITPMDVDIDSLRTHITRSLARYMVPAIFIPMTSLPLTVNHKVDRTRLPQPQRGSTRKHSRTRSCEISKHTRTRSCEILAMDADSLPVPLSRGASHEHDISKHTSHEHETSIDDEIDLVLESGRVTPLSNRDSLTASPTFIHSRPLSRTAQARARLKTMSPIPPILKTIVSPPTPVATIRPLPTQTESSTSTLSDPIITALREVDHETIEAYVLSAWCHVLNINPHDDSPLLDSIDTTSTSLFELGGTSLTLYKLVQYYNKYMKSTYGMSQVITIVELFTHPTMEQQTNFLWGKIKILKEKLEPAPKVTPHLTPVSTPQQSRRPSTITAPTTSTSTSSETCPIAIVGMSGRISSAQDLNAFWAALESGTSLIHQLSDDELGHLNAKQLSNPDFRRSFGRMSDIDRFDADFFKISHREAVLLDPQQRILLEQCVHALHDACIDPDVIAKANNGNSNSIGVFVAASESTYATHNLDHIQRGAVTAQDSQQQYQLAIANHMDTMATRIAYKLNCTGPAVALTTACSSSLSALVMACRSIDAHDCGTALVGGVSIPCPQSGYVYQDGMIMSNSGVCRPFDAQADGTVLGSAAVTIVIKRLTDAQRDGNPIYAVIKAASINNDGSSKMGYTTPSVQGQSACISHALSQAHIDPHHMDYIEAHGTATKIGDPCEVQALTQAFKQATTQEMKYQYCALGSVKSNVGHTDTAAGLVGLIKCVLAMKNKVIPPTVNFTTSNPSIDFAHSPFYINNKAIPWQSPHHIRTCGVSSFGIGGTNTHVILQEHIQPNIEMIPISHHLFILSAPTVSTLIRMLSQWITYLTSTSITSQQFQSICYTLAHGRRAYAMRVTCVVQHVDELISMLQQQKSIAEQQSPSGSATPATNTPTRMASRRTSVSISIPTSPTSTSTGPTNLEAALQHQNHANIQLSITSNMSQGAQLVLLFPGQGTFDIIRAREMYLSNSLYRHHFHHAATLVDEITTSTYPEMWMIRVLLSDAPIATTTRTSMIQLFLFIHEYTMSQLLLSCMDITPYAVMGHSLGEYVAACVAGYLSLKDALYLVHTRQLLMNTLPSGSMLAMNIPPSEAYTHVNASISLAAINSSSQAVYSGLTTDIQALAATCASKGIQHKLLGLAAPMHSHLIEQILPAFHTACTRITSSTPTIRMISNVTGDWIPADGILDASYWCEHMRHTVKFYHGVDTLIHTSTSRLVMVEVGHGRTLTNMMTSSFPSITPRAVEAVSTPIDPSIPWYRRSRISPTSHACQFRCIVMSPTLVDATRSYAETWAQLWHNHISITWKSVYQQVHPITVPSTSEVTALTAIPIPSTTSHHIIPLISGLPSYPFDHQHSFWMEPPHHVRRPSALALSMSKPLRIARGKNAPAAKVTRVRGTSGNRKTPSPAAAPGNKSRRGSTVRTPPAPTQRSISRGSSGASRPGATNVNVNSSGSLSAHTSPKAGSGSITPNGNASTSTSTVAWAIPLQTRASPAPRTAHAMKRSASGNIRRPATATATATAHPTMRKSSDGTPVTISRSTTEPVVHTPATTTPSLDHVNRALAVATSNRRKKPSPPQSSVASAPASPAISASRTLNLAPPPLTLTISTSPSTSPTSPTAAAAALPPLSPRSLSSPKKRGSVPTIAPTRTRPRITPAPTNRPRVRAATAATMTTPTKTAPVAPRAAAPAIRARSAAAAPSSQTLDRDAEAAADAAMDAAIEAAVAAGTPITWDAVAIERMVKRAFHHVLGFPIALMDGNTHFFERGGDSFMGIALLAFLQRKTHVTTDARMLYNAPTVKALTQLLLETHQTTLTSSSSRSSSPSTPTHTRKHHVVVLRAGNGMNPLFVAAPVGGTLYIYRDFLTTLSPHQTVYGFDYPMDMEENSIEPLTVEQLASEYIQQMLEIYPHQQCSNGYQLYGTSFGGMVCYEMLIQLHRMNVPVHLLGMLDTPRSDCFRQFFSIGNKAAILYGMFGDKYDFTLEQIEAHSKDDATLLQFAIDTGFIRQGRKGTEKITTTSTSTLSPDILGAWSALDVYVQIFERNVHSLLAYRGDPLPHDVKTAIVFLQVASPKPGDPIEPAQSWRALLAPQHDYTVKFIPGHHLSSNFQPHAIYIERALKHYMHPIITTSTSTAPSATSTSTSQHVPSHKETEHKTMEMTVTPPAAYLLPVGSSQSAPVSSHVSPLMRATSDMRTPLPLLSLTSIADVDGDVDGQSTVSTSRPPAPVVRVDSSDSDTDIVDGVAVGVGVFVGDSYPSLERDGMIQSGPSSGSRSADGEVKRTRSPVLNGRSNGKMGEIQQQNNDNEKPHHKLNCTSISHDHANIPATDQSKKSRCDRTSTSIVTST